jgi:hypothetical protein
MLFKSVAILLLLLLQSCGNDEKTKPLVQELPPPPSPVEPVSTDPQVVLETYLAEWESLYEPVRTPISITEIEEANILGVCITWQIDGELIKEIRIDETSFTERIISSPIAARTIIFHELGHCDLDRDHGTDFAVAGTGDLIPYSIMFASLWPEPEVYEQFNDHYMQELFFNEGILEKVALGFIPLTRIGIIKENGNIGVVEYN